MIKAKDNKNRGPLVVWTLVLALLSVVSMAPTASAGAVQNGRIFFSSTLNGIERTYDGDFPPLKGKTLLTSAAYSVNGDGSDWRPLTDDFDPKSSNSVGAVSPDGAYLYVYSDQNEKMGVHQIYEMTRGGAITRQLTRGPSWNLSPSISSDGRKMVFTSTRDDPDPTDSTLVTSTYVMDLRTEQVNKLADLGEGSSAAKFSPVDANKIVYNKRISSNVTLIYIYDTASGSSTRVSPNDTLDSRPSWSPDGKRIIFDRRDPVNAPFDLYTINADGTDERRVTSTSTHHEYAAGFSPDGERIVFTRALTGSGQVYNIATASVDGTDIRQITQLTDPKYSASAAVWAAQVEQSPGKDGSVTESQPDRQGTIGGGNTATPVNPARLGLWLYRVKLGRVARKAKVTISRRALARIALRGLSGGVTTSGEIRAVYGSMVALRGKRCYEITSNLRISCRKARTKRLRSIRGIESPNNERRFKLRKVRAKSFRAGRTADGRRSARRPASRYALLVRVKLSDGRSQSFTVLFKIR